jgi:microcystin degradation protein MlrC
MGAAFFAVADGDMALARRAARYMAERAWARREELTGNLPSPAEAVKAAIAAPEGPVVLMDVGDNVGAGSPANSTVLFDEIVKQNGSDALVVLYDPAAVGRCVAAGVGQRVTVAGVEGVLRVLADGRFIEREVRHGGWGACDQGLTAVVETADGHTVVVTSRRMAPMSLQQVLSLGVRPEWKKIVIAKGVVAPRAAYAPVAKEIVLVDTPGVTSDNPRHFDYKHRRKPLYPLEADEGYLPG